MPVKLEDLTAQTLDIHYGTIKCFVSLNQCYQGIMIKRNQREKMWGGKV